MMTNSAGRFRRQLMRVNSILSATTPNPTGPQRPNSNCWPLYKAHSVQLGCMTHETLRDYAHQTFTRVQKTLEALTRFLTMSLASCLAIASGFTPTQWPENHHYPGICREHYRRRNAASSFLILASKNRIWPLDCWCARC